MKLVTPPKSKREIKIELTGSKNIGMSICLGCGVNPVGAFGICAGCDGLGVRYKTIIDKSKVIKSDPIMVSEGCTLSFTGYLITGFAIAFVFSVIVLGLTT